ncbi:MAG: hypothetical protein AB7V40_02095 [Methyloceanibacter sp.]
MKTCNTRLFPQAQVTRILALAAGALVALAAASIPARADDAVQRPERVGPRQPVLAECHLLKRAISRRACRARLERDAQIDIAAK